MPNDAYSHYYSDINASVLTWKTSSTYLIRAVLNGTIFSSLSSGYYNNIFIRIQYNHNTRAKDQSQADKYNQKSHETQLILLVHVLPLQSKQNTSNETYFINKEMAILSTDISSNVCCSYDINVNI
eukprot:14565_1